MFHDSDTGHSFEVLPSSEQSNDLTEYPLHFKPLFLRNCKIVKEPCHVPY